MRKNFSALVSVFLCALLVLCPGSIYAVGSGGYENASYSAKTLAQSNAVVARPQDPSTITLNPAGLVELEGIQVSAGLQALSWNIFHRDQVTGDFNQNNGKLIPIPSFYLTANPGELLDNRVAFGVGVNSPFGLCSSFPSIGAARYVGYKNEMKMLATTMAGAIRLTDWLDVGAGATNYYIYKYGQIFNYPNANIVGVPGAPDGKALTETDGYAWGWNLGVLLKPLPHHKVGFSYRGRTTATVHGRVVIDDLVLGAAQGYDTSPHFESGAHSKVPIPANLTIAYAYEPSEKWAAEFDFGFTDWRAFKNQNFWFDRGNPTLNSLGTIARDYSFSWNFNWGGHYQLNKKVDLQGGFFFYTAAAPKSHVDAFLPDANRFAWTLGTSYKFTDRLSLDLSYMFMLLASRSISNPTVLTKTGESIDGRYTSIIHGGFATLNYRFDFPGAKGRKGMGDTPQSPVIETAAP